MKYITSMTDEMADSAIYTKYSDGTTSSITVIVDTEKVSNQVKEGRTMLDSSFALTSLDFKPEIYDTLLIGTELYKVESYQKNNGVYLLEISKNSRPTNHHTKGRFR